MTAFLLALLLSPAAAAIDLSLQMSIPRPLAPPLAVGLAPKILLVPSALFDWHAVPPSAPSAFASLTMLAQRLAPEQQQTHGPQESLDAFFSGTVPQSHAERLAEIVASAQASVTARQVLVRATALAQINGPTPVVFSNLGKNNLGEYDYAAGILRLDRSYLSGDPRQGAATFVHELIHVLQHAQGVPAEALEMELEAHALTLRVLEELGVPKSQWDPFSREAARRLAHSPKDYSAWLAEQLPDKLLLERGNFDDLADSLEDDIERLENRNSAAKLRQRFIDDAARLNDAEGQAAYARFARRVRALLERESARLRR